MLRLLLLSLFSASYINAAVIGIDFGGRFLKVCAALGSVRLSVHTAPARQDGNGLYGSCLLEGELSPAFRWAAFTLT